jgi:hypothetical protein
VVKYSQRTGRMLYIATQSVDNTPTENEKVLKMSLHTGRQLKLLASESRKVTTTQTAAEAVQSIINKFGSISDNTKYYHRGNGIWSIYTISEDRRKTGKIAPDTQHWHSEPWRWDLKKIDTEEGLTIKRKIVSERKPRHNKNQKTKQKNIFARF